MNKELRAVKFADQSFLGQRFQDGNESVSSISILDCETREPVATVKYDSTDLGMTIETNGRAVDRRVIEDLFKRADNYLV